ncbi:MAG TPA: type 1 glutamine amidotransferase [Myxococcales bacterium]|nr:type 1 glutamine amidotransferase [Myxococcales bacterium]
MIVIQHEPGEGPGALAPFLSQPRFVRTWAGDRIPQEAEALLVLGGGMGVYEQDRYPHLGEEIRLLRWCVERERPVLGICLGSQLLAKAVGGEVAKAPRKEIGFYRVRLSAAAREDPLFSGTPESFVAFHWHGDAFTLPKGAVPLASSTLTPLQAFRFGPCAWGVQFHLETDAEVLSAMMSGEAELREAGVEAGHLRAQAERELPRLNGIAQPIFSRFAALVRGALV